MSVPVLNSNMFPERLYLSKGGDGDIYVNNCRILRKNQIDGLRGLYRIFKRKNPGVILNDAADSGKTVLVSLFIESIQSILDNPVLILCNDDHEIEHWKEILLKWTRYTEDNIAINSTNPYLRKSVFIQSMDLSNSFFRRCWSILILKNDEITKEIRKMVFRAEFKIWITSVDVFKDLSLLSSVGTFINPDININTALYEMTNKKLSEKIKNIVLLETFTKDFVVRTDHLKSILQKSNDTNKSMSNISKKKNKDASGTKIKRSKRKITDVEPRKCNKKATTREIEKNDDDEQDSPSLISFTPLNKSYELRNTPHCIHNDEITHHSNDNNTLNMNQSTATVLKTDAQMTKDEDSTQSLTGLSENTTNDNIESVSQIKLAIVDDIEMSPKPCTQNYVIENSMASVEIVNEIKSDDIYDRETIDFNADTSQIKLNYSEDVNVELGNKVYDINAKIGTENDISEATNITKSNEMTLTNDVIKSPNTNTQVAGNVEDNTFDKKLNDLELKTLMKFKGSFLDSIF